MNKCIKLTLIKLNASYSTNFKFKVQSQIKNLNNQKVETNEGFKYAKETNFTQINEQLELNIEDISLINLDTELEFFLQIKTKTGYKTAGLGKINFSNIKNNDINFIEIEKCPLGKGNFEVQIELPKLLLKQFEPKNNNSNEENVNKQINNINNNNKNNDNNNNDNINNDDKINKLKKKI